MNLKKYISFEKCSPDCRDDDCPRYKKGKCNPRDLEGNMWRLSIYKIADLYFKWEKGEEKDERGTG